MELTRSQPSLLTLLVREGSRETIKHLCEEHFVRKALIDIKEREERQLEIESTIEERKR